MHIRNTHAVTRPSSHATAILQSDNRKHFSASSYLPVMQTLRKQLAVEKPVVALGEGSRGLPKVTLRHDELDAASQRLRANFRLEIDDNWHRIGACERTLKLCTALDPRYKLALWSEED